ncbi:HNH endonuclease [Nocardioides marmoraquaticus]
MIDTLTDAATTLVARLGTEDVDHLPPEALVDLLAVCERLKGAAAACQARATVAFADHERAVGRGDGVPAQVGLATRQSPYRARRFVGFAHALAELPRTYDALAAGETSEFRAFSIARETMLLSREDRAAVDRELHQRPGGIGALSDRGAEAEARLIGQRLDPAAAVRRNAAAVKQRRVSLRPAPDGMARLSAVLPVVDGISVWAELCRIADTARAHGDERARGEVMADELVTRILGRTAAESPVEVTLVMTDAALLGTDDPAAHHEPAQVVTDTGLQSTIPADHARALVRDAADVFVRRLYTDPQRGDLVAMDSRRRSFTGQLRRLLVLRDQRCRTPWCDAPIRHLDHIRRATDRGPTKASNAQGLCEACNHAKEAARVRQQPKLDGSVVTLTPTGHTYRGHRPRPPSPPPPTRADWSHLETWLRSELPA